MPNTRDNRNSPAGRPRRRGAAPAPRAPMEPGAQKPGQGAPKDRQPPQRRGMLLRCVAVVVMFVLAAGMLGMRLSQLQIDEASEWEALANDQQISSTAIEPARGAIYDTNLKPMAQSATVWTVEASPDVLNANGVADGVAEKNPARVAARELAAILALDEETLYEKLSDKTSLYYKVKAKIEKPEADAVRAMCTENGLYGIYLTEDTKRYYPFEELAATVLGFSGADGNGLEGLERQYDEVLAGTPGRVIKARDAWGYEIAAGGEGVTYPAEDGHSIVLTVDTDIQRSVEKHLKTAVEKNGVRQRAFAIVMDVNTGAILAMAVYPSFNPNQPYDIYDAAALEAINALPEGSQERSDAQGLARTLQWRNKALADTYEPGSVMKVITAAAALDSGIYTQDSGFYCGSSIEVADRTYSCAGETAKSHGNLSLRTALIDSCNVSFIQIGAGLGVHSWYSYLKSFGLTEPTGVDLPGEPSLSAMNVLVHSEQNMGPVQLASCSFGQSNKYTALQMITACSAAVNGGNLMQPYIVRQELDAAGNVVKNYEPQVKRQVVSEETSAQIRDILEELVADTVNGQNSYLPGYRIGGKSGTSEKLDVMEQTGRDDAYISSFMGFAPANDPQIAVLVALDEPVDNSAWANYFGGRMAGPAARDIIGDTLSILGDEPSYTTDEDLARTTVTCPKVEGLDITAAQREVSKAGLTFRMVGEGGTVLQQSPAAYSHVPYGGEVIFYTVEGAAEEVTVPDVVGKKPAEAADQLKGLGLNVLHTGVLDSAAGAVVVSQDLPPDGVVPKGTIITLVIEDHSNVIPPEG